MMIAGVDLGAASSFLWEIAARSRSEISQMTSKREPPWLITQSARGADSLLLWRRPLVLCGHLPSLRGSGMQNFEIGHIFENFVLSYF